MWRIIVLISGLAIALCSIAAEGRQSAHFIDGQALLEKAQIARKTASSNLLEAGKLRREINTLRAQARRDPATAQNNTQRADALSQKLIALQKSGAELREQANTLDQKALNAFEEGMVEIFKPELQQRTPLAMDDNTPIFLAHNTRFRSVHPTLIDNVGTPVQEAAIKTTPKDMSLIVPALAEQNAPQDLDIRVFQLSRDQQLIAHIEVADDSDKQVPMNRIHRWHLFVSDLRGKPVQNANIQVKGHMPGHVHGLPTAPRVVAEVAPGVYRVDGIKFQMKGWWVMQFEFPGENASSSGDAVVFNLVL